MAHSEPGYGGMPAPAHGVPDAYSTAPGDNLNRAARADGAAAHRNEDQQNLQAGSNKKVRMDDVTKLVAEENASRSKFPRYQGLDRWELVEKMGDGAFSNVYRARDLEGKFGEVAIKVVRKFEMNSQQVSFSIRHTAMTFLDFLFPFSAYWRFFIPFVRDILCDSLYQLI